MTCSRFAPSSPPASQEISSSHQRTCCILLRVIFTNKPKVPKNFCPGVSFLLCLLLYFDALLFAVPPMSNCYWHDQGGGWPVKKEECLSNGALISIHVLGPKSFFVGYLSGHIKYVVLNIRWMTNIFWYVEITNHVWSFFRWVIGGVNGTSVQIQQHLKKHVGLSYS